MAFDLLFLDNITVRSFSNVLFSNLTFGVNKGEQWALVGASGSGKSALLQTIAGKLNITAGSITYPFFEKHLANQPSHKHQTVYQFIALVESKHHFKNLSNTTDLYYQQRYNSFDSEDALTAGQYLQTIPVAANLHWDMERVTRLLRLEELLPKQIIKLSNGETKRLRLASALLKNTYLLLLDNPLAGLDVNTRKEFNAIIDEVAASGITIVMTAQADDIPDSITHIAVLKDMAISSVTTTAEFNPVEHVYSKPTVIDDETLKNLFVSAKGISYKQIVSMKSIVIRYGEATILNNINWQITTGERWALLGPNGAGKSTLLSLINGDNPQAYANDITLFDKKRGTGESIWDIKKKIGFVSPEFYQYFPADNSCLQVIESGYYDTLGLFRPSDKQKQDVALRWMKVLEIEQYARKPLKNIPASAQRLCLLARALIKHPPLLIFDEPCQGLDQHQQEHFKQVVDAICRNSNVTLIYVTHYQHEIPDSVDKVLRLNRGEVVI